MMPAIFVRSGCAADIPAIMAVIADARAFLHGQHIDQWQGVYPDQAAVEADIAAGYSRVLLVDGQVVGIAALVPGPDPYYQFLEGRWTNGRNAPYVAIHRFAIGDAGRGLHLARPFLTELFSELYRDGVRDVRIDTHRHNKIMQHVIVANGFDPRGIVYLDQPVPEFLAYQLILDKPAEL